MAPVPTPSPPGSMTVPPLAGWEQILIVVVLAIALAVAFLVVGAAGGGAQGRADWQAWLDARSTGRGEHARVTPDPAANGFRAVGTARTGAASPGMDQPGRT